MIWEWIVLGFPAVATKTMNEGFFISAGKATLVLPVRKDDGRKWLKLGGAVAELSYALLSGDKINENQTDPGFAPRPGQKNKHEICIQLTKKTII